MKILFLFLLFFPSILFAHFNGHVSPTDHPRHYYRISHSSAFNTDYMQTPQEACSQAFDNYIYYTDHFETFWDNQSKQWECHFFAPNGAMMTEVFSNKVAYHCGYTEKWDGIELFACVENPANPCAQFENDIINIDKVRPPTMYGFNVPTDDNLNGTMWEQYKGCHFNKMSAVPVTVNGETCYDTTYFATGGIEIDVDTITNAEEPIIETKLPEYCECAVGQATDGFGNCIDSDPATPPQPTGACDPTATNYAACIGMNSGGSNSNLIQEIDPDVYQSDLMNYMDTVVNATITTFTNDYEANLMDDTDQFAPEDLSNLETLLNGLIPQPATCTTVILDMGPIFLNIECAKFNLFKQWFGWVLYVLTAWALYVIVTTPIESKV